MTTTRTAQPSATRRELSGITPSGSLTLGNHLGALRRFREHQDNGYYFVADLHAMTTPHEPERLRELSLSTAALFLASGLDPERAVVFVQSDVPAHVELAYLLECTAHVGELNRMIQFKEKGGRPGTRASLFSYPCLMAADILLYDTAFVPVGGDQSQHVELARDLAERFNAIYGPTFTVPLLAPAAIAARVCDLADPVRKMSKSAPLDAPGVIRILDTPDVIRRKIKRAVTDSDGELRYDPDGKPGVANLADIIAALTGETPQDVLDAQSGYGALKQACADAVIAELDPIRRRHDELVADPAALRAVLARGAERASAVADPIVARARAAMGLVRNTAEAVEAVEGVVRLGPDDAGEVTTLQRAAFVTEAQRHDDLQLPALSQPVSSVAAELEHGLGLGIRDTRGRLVAAVRVAVDGPTAQLGRLVVVPDRQGSGLGTRLMRAAEQALPSTVRDVELVTGEHSTPNLRLYARLGYVETGREPVPAGYDVVRMSKRLTVTGSGSARPR